MEKITEILIGNLSIKPVDDRLAFLVDKINQVIKPPKEATAENVNIRAMYVVNDLVNSHGGRFRRDDIAHLANLIIDTPVLVGHNHSEAPLARTFHAELEERDNILWLKSYFYWPKSVDSEKDELLLKIDSGVLKECSISFTYTTPECSVCGDDIRKCPHEIEYQSSDPSRPHFIYGGITQVLETSLVYKGSIKGTYITDKLSALPADCMIINFYGRNFTLPVPVSSIGRKIRVMPLDKYGSSLPCILHQPTGIAITTALKNGIPHLLFKRS